MIVGVKSSTILARATPDLEAILAISEPLDLVGFYVFTTETASPGHAASARMFAPRYGIDEETATGMAAGPLACLLRDRLGISGDTIVIEQGMFMAPPSPSLLEARLDLSNGAITGLMVGGFGAVMEDRKIDF